SPPKDSPPDYEAGQDKLSTCSLATLEAEIKDEYITIPKLITKQLQKKVLTVHDESQWGQDDSVGSMRMNTVSPAIQVTHLDLGDSEPQPTVEHTDKAKLNASHAFSLAGRKSAKESNSVTVKTVAVTSEQILSVAMNRLKSLYTFRRNDHAFASYLSTYLAAMNVFLVSSSKTLATQTVKFRAIDLVTVVAVYQLSSVFLEMIMALKLDVRRDCA
ncbi:hypothetical protein HDU96_001245, partial [Phlyctochytrium bullatum]